MTADLTVLIPTTDRPDMLRTALGSVLRQTALPRIKQVIVSENLGSERSHKLCAEFPGLPIWFILRTPPLRPLDHALALFSEDHGTAYVAVLHDDDWWRPFHLERSLTALDDHPAAAACYGGYWCVIGEHSSFVGQQDNNLWWFAAGRPPIDSSPWLLTHHQAMLAALGGALGHYSSLVARTAALRASAPIYRLENPMDNDRLLTVELSRHGDLLYHPLPEVFVRQHPTQDFRRFSDREYHDHMSGTTRYVLQLARQDGLDIRRTLEQLYASHPGELRPYFAAHYAPGWCRDPLAGGGVLPEFLQKPPGARGGLPRLRAWIPPVFLDWARRWRR